MVIETMLDKKVACYSVALLVQTQDADSISETILDAGFWILDKI